MGGGVSAFYCSLDKFILRGRRNRSLGRGWWRRSLSPPPRPEAEGGEVDSHFGSDALQTCRAAHGGQRFLSPSISGYGHLHPELGRVSVKLGAPAVRTDPPGKGHRQLVLRRPHHHTEAVRRHVEVELGRRCHAGYSHAQNHVVGVARAGAGAARPTPEDVPGAHSPPQTEVVPWYVAAVGEVIHDRVGNLVLVPDCLGRGR